MIFFAVDKSKPNGRQSWCRLCKDIWEMGPDGVWKRLRAYLEKHEPSSLRPPNGWTEELYLKRWSEVDGKCELCGAGLGEWQVGGHRLDRIDNDTPHIPSNCQMLCWVCNRRKSNKTWQTAKIEVRPYLEEFGRGKVPWQTIEPWARRVSLRYDEAESEEVECLLPLEMLWATQEANR
jgi:hypothetical protein